MGRSQRRSGGRGEIHRIPDAHDAGEGVAVDSLPAGKHNDVFNFLARRAELDQRPQRGNSTEGVADEVDMPEGILQLIQHDLWLF